MVKPAQLAPPRPPTPAKASAPPSTPAVKSPPASSKPPSAQANPPARGQGTSGSPGGSGGRPGFSTNRDPVTAPVPDRDNNAKQPVRLMGLGGGSTRPGFSNNQDPPSAPNSKILEQDVKPRSMGGLPGLFNPNNASPASSQNKPDGSKSNRPGDNLDLDG